MSYQKLQIGTVCRILALSVFAASLPAADFWQSKPFTEWTDKEVQKILATSPWVRQVIVSTSGSSPEASHGNDRRGSTIEDNPTGMRVPDTKDSAEGTEGRTRGGAAGDEDRTPAMPGRAQFKLTIQWRSALPVKQALARAKFGAEAATSPEARQFLDALEPNYVIAVLGIPRPTILGGGEPVKQALLERAALSGGGKDWIHASDIQFRTSGGGGGGADLIDAFFVFPKAGVVTIDDKEIEFSIKLASFTVKERFRLKDMVFKGTLEL
jgi:hypothetical protein